MKKSLGVIFCFLFVISIPSSLACGPFFLTPIFVFDSRLENTEDFARGNIGIIQPTYYRSVLLVAYRTLNKLPFSAYEQKELLRDWQAEYEYVDNNEPTRTAAITHWLAARKMVLATGTAPEISTDRSLNNGYNVFLNCTASAFDNATKTLAARIAEHGLTDKNVNQWVQAQDQVFANSNTIPEEAVADAPAWVKNDRDYQIAAAYFYATDYDEADKRFAAIAQNKSSPWRDTAVYLLSRVALRRASAVLSDDSLDAQKQQAQALVYYQQAEKQLNNILADPSLAQFHDSAQQLLNLVTFRTNPEKLHNTLAKKLLATAENKHFYQDLTDYRWILDKVTASDDAFNLRQKLRQQSDLTDWIFTLQRVENNDYALAVEKSLTTNNKAWLVAFLTKANKDAFAHAVEKWQATKNEAWLVASLIKATKDSPNLADLITASKAVARTSPAFLTVNYHLARLQIAQGQTDEPRKMIDSILSDKSLQLSVSTTNQLLSERLLLAQNLDEFVQFSQRHAAAFGFNGSDSELVDLAVPKEGDDYYKKQRPWLNRTLFDTDATGIMNALMPLSLLQKLAQHPNLPAYLKPKVMVSAWTRAVVLTNEKKAFELAPETMNCIPELKQSMPAFIEAKDPKARLFEADWIMLNNPAMRPVVDYGLEREAGFSAIDDYRDNWWCNFKQADTSGKGDAPQLVAPVFLSPAELVEATTENATIAKHASSGSNYLATKVSEWATQIPTDKRLPNALYLAVKATRYGCQNCETEKVSKAAFDILKARFGNTPWKKKTPYWFKDENCLTK
ncbi:MAG: hypothetical protein WCP01_05570 [Methylococcaceae bacterium]